MYLLLKCLIILDSNESTLTRNVLVRYIVLWTMDLLQLVPEHRLRADLVFHVRVGRVSAFEGEFFIS